ncbi:hypothetical protein FE256_05985 [Microbacterium sp. 5K110]|nr:hypothetical protein FE256_05985 [Microbacterium sp. 5K110]
MTNAPPPVRRRSSASQAA